MMSDWIGFLRGVASVWSDWTLLLVWLSVALTLYFAIVAGLGYARR